MYVRAMQLCCELSLSLCTWSWINHDCIAAIFYAAVLFHLIILLIF